MKKYIASVLAFICVLGLIGCSQHTGDVLSADSGKQTGNVWSGTVSEIFTEEVNGDLVEVIKIECKDNEPMYFAIIEDTKYIKYSSDTGEFNVEIAKEDLCIGIYVEVYFGSYHNSGYCSIDTIRVIESLE